MFPICRSAARMRAADNRGQTATVFPARRLTFLFLFLAVAAGFLASPPPAGAITERIANGDFATGGAGWSAQFSGNGGFFVDTAGTTTPRSGLPTTSAGGGSGLYAVSDETGAGTHVLYQNFTVPLPVGRVLLMFDMFVNDWASTQAFDVLQHARVDVMTTTSSFFDVGAGVLFNAYIGTDGGPLPNDFTHYEFDITPVVRNGGTYRLRFFTTAGLNVLNQGVDNIHVLHSVPEPSTGLLVALGVPLATAGFCRHQHSLRRESSDVLVGVR